MSTQLITEIPTVIILRTENDRKLTINHVKIKKFDTSLLKHLVIIVYTKDKVLGTYSQQNETVFRFKNFLDEIKSDGTINNDFNEQNFPEPHPIEVKMEISSDDGSVKFPEFEIEVDYVVT